MAHIINRALKASSLLFLLLSLSACVSPGIKSVTSSSVLGSNEIIVVGKIKMVPKFEPGEQVLEGFMIGKDQVKGSAFIALSDELIDLPCWNVWTSLCGKLNKPKTCLTKTPISPACKNFANK
jgi:hypothetical protein